MKKISIYPLYELDSDLAPPVEIANGITIISNNIDLNKINKLNVSREDAHHLRDTQLCLQIDENVIPPDERGDVGSKTTSDLFRKGVKSVFNSYSFRR